MSRRALPVYLASIWICLTGSTVQAQDPPSSNQTPASASDSRDSNVYNVPGPSSLAKRFTSNVLLDQKDIWTSPFHITRDNAKWWILAGLGTAGLLAADHQTSQALPFSGTTVNSGNNLSRIGQWYSVFPFAGGLYAAGLMAGSPKLKETGLESIEALADADLFVTVVKVVAQRQRPGDGDHGGHFEKGGSSFYSGHSTQAWALASVLADEYGNHRWVPLVAYSYATTVSVSRILAQEHFTSDVFVGAAAGFFIGRYVVRTQHAHQTHTGSRHAHWVTPSSITPSVGPAGALFSVAWTQ